MAFDGYTLEASLAGGNFQSLTSSLLPNHFLGVILTFDPSTPELLELKFRICAVRGAIPSSYSNVVSYFRGVRPPADVSATPLRDGVSITWRKASLVADNVRLEKATLTPDGTPGPWSTLNTITPNALSFLDGDLLEGSRYAYRVTYFMGSVASAPVTLNGPAFPLSTPSAFAAAVQADGIHLTWRNRSALATELVVWRSLGEDSDYANSATPIAHLAPSTGALLDAVASPGTYAYYLEIKSSTTSICSPIVTVHYQVPNAPTLASQVLTLPAATWLFRSPMGQTWLSLDDNHSPGLRRFNGSTWEAHPALGTLWAYPFVRFDRQDHPHFVSMKPATGQGYDLIHEWFDGTSWQSESILTRPVFMVPYRYDPGIAFELDSTDQLHIILDESQGEVPSTSELFYLHKGSSGWVEESLNLLPLVPYDSRFTLAVDPANAPHVVVWGLDMNGYEFIRATDGSWTSTLIPEITQGDGAFSKLVLLAQDQALLFYDATPASASLTGEEDLMCMEKVAGAWQPPYRLGPLSPFGIRNDGEVALSADHRRVALLANASVARILYLFSSGTWTPAALTPRFLGYQRNPSVLFDGAGRVTVFGRDSLTTEATATYSILQESP